MSSIPIANSVDQVEIEYARTPWWILVLRRKFRLKSRTPMPRDGEPEGKEQEEPARGFWANEYESVLSLLGLAVGLGNVWRFPWMVWRNNGAVFLIPYFLMLIFCGLPLFLMEMTIGQYSGCGPGNVFNVAPIFKGLGWCVLANSVLGAAYYITVITWAFYYMFNSFRASLPWASCHNEWNSDSCFSLAEKLKCEQNSSLYFNRTSCLANTTSNFMHYKSLNVSEWAPAPQEFFNRRMYDIYYPNTDIQRRMEDSVTVKWDLTLVLMFAWVLVFLCIFKGIKSSGKVVYFTALFPYLAITGLLIVAARLEGASKGIEYYFVVTSDKLEALKYPQVWVDAASQIFYSMGIFTGGVMTYASYNRYNNNVLRDCLIVGLGNSLTSIYAGFAIFSVLGHMSVQLDKPINETVQSGSALVFVAYPEVINKLPGASFWSVVFFLMLITLGLDSEFGMMETVLTAILDKKPSLLPKKTLIAALLCFSIFILSLSTVTQTGIYWEELLNYFAGWTTIFLALLNAIIYAWVYGAGKLVDHLQHMINRKFPVTVVWILLFLWKGLCLIIILVISFFNIYHISKVDYHKLVLPDWAQAIGWMTALFPLILLPVAAVYTYICDVRSNPYSAETFCQRLARLTRPTDKWIPSYMKHEQDIAQISTGNLNNSSRTNGTITTGYGSHEIANSSANHTSDQEKITPEYQT